MTDTHAPGAADEILAPGLRYREEIKTVRSHAVRYCCLWLDGEEAPVSELEVHSFEQRFGAIAVAAEGIGGAETPPPFRRRGYMRQLLSRAIAGMAQRVNVAFVGDAIAGMYEKFGFHTCLAEGYLSLKIGAIERALERSSLPPDRRIVRAYEPADLPGMVELYNAVHAQRPWTHARPATWNRLVPVQTWSPGSTALVLVEGEQVAGYAIYKEFFYGWPNSALAVDELAALDQSAAQRLLAELAQQCWRHRLNHFTVYEPLDSVVGGVARRFGCEYHLSFPATGGMMGAILQREALLEALEPELHRRLTTSEFSELASAHGATFPALVRGDLITDNDILLRLLLGDWSLREAMAAGVSVPPPVMPLCAAWFPGGGAQTLPLPYAHKLDRY